MKASDKLFALRAKYIALATANLKQDSSYFQTDCAAIIDGAKLKTRVELQESIDRLQFKGSQEEISRDASGFAVKISASDAAEFADEFDVIFRDGVRIETDNGNG